jgi:hypothetical protein
VELIHDLEPIEVSDSEAQKFKMQHGDKCDIWAGEGGQWFAKFKKGASVFIPKVFKFSRTVADQIGRLVAMAYRKILSHRQTRPLSGHWFAWQKL